MTRLSTHRLFDKLRIHNKSRAVVRKTHDSVNFDRYGRLFSLILLEEVDIN